MHFVCDLEIGVPRERVIELFDDPSNLPKWQPDLLRFEHVSGVPGQPQAKSRLVYKAGKGEFELIETITERKLPDVFSGTYESKFGCTTIQNQFLDQGQSTRWISDTHFVGRGLMRVLSVLMRGMMRKQTMQVVQNFKKFAETGSV